ncbi:MAG: hypothetical protein IT381_22025 [Deltaproteobacteria bacterium]|nr:hypothetical protein [Deltaproteobacteria bacterium]
MTGAQIVTSSVSYTAQGRILLFDAGLRAVAESRHGPATPTAIAAAGERIWFGTSDGRVNAAWPEAAAYYRCFDGPVEQLFVIGDHLLARSLGQVAVYGTPETLPALASFCRRSARSPRSIRRTRCSPRRPGKRGLSAPRARRTRAETTPRSSLRWRSR